LTVYHLPACTPELNPAEGIWDHLKKSLGNPAVCSTAELAALARTRLKKMHPPWRLHQRQGSRRRHRTVHRQLERTLPSVRLDQDRRRHPHPRRTPSTRLGRVTRRRLQRGFGDRLVQCLLGEDRHLVPVADLDVVRRGLALAGFDQLLEAH
jgi:putative transposase